MRLKKLELQNFRSFEEATLEFDERLSVIVGVNGAGKTSVLEAAAIALGAYFTKFDGISALAIEKSDARVKAYEIGESDDVESQYPVVVSATAALENGNALKWSRVLTGSKGRTTVGEAREIINYGESIQKKVRDGDATSVLPIFGYYGTGRLWDYHRDRKRNDSNQSVSSRTQGYRDCFDGTANIKLMMHWFERRSYQSLRKKENGETDNTLDAVLNAIAQCYANASGLKDVKVQYNFDTKSLEVLFTDESGKKMRLPFDQLSDGYKGAVSLIADIAYRMATLNPQLKGDVLASTDGIILIDEVDLHLHPAWQRHVVNDLATIFPKVQFILTTHAASVVNSVKKENLILLKENQVLGMSNEVYGKNVGAVMKEIMDVADRPEDVQKRFEEFYSALDARDLTRAEDVLNHLHGILAVCDPELASCDVRLRLEKLRAGKL